jgi:hypothetical protein
MAKHKQAFTLKKEQLPRYEKALKKSGLYPYKFNRDAVMKEVDRVLKGKK